MEQLSKIPFLHKLEDSRQHSTQNITYRTKAFVTVFSTLSGNCAIPIVHFSQGQETIHKVKSTIKVPEFQNHISNMKISETEMRMAKSNQSILKEINTEYSLEGLILKLQYLAT